MVKPTNVDYARFGAFVRTRRRAAKLSMDELASRAGCCRSTIHRLEHGRRATAAGVFAGPHPCTAAGVLLTLGVRPREVIGLVGGCRWTTEVLDWMRVLEEVSSNHDAAGLGALVKRARRANGWTVAELAARTGVNANFIAPIESGDTRNEPGRSTDRHRRPAAEVVASLLAAVAASVGEVRGHLGHGPWATEVMRRLDERPPTNAA
jgi:transcriptional regulator with XRE-family HTH domain